VRREAIEVLPTASSELRAMSLRDQALRRLRRAECSVTLFALLRVLLDELPDVGLDGADLGVDLVRGCVETNGSGLVFQRSP
jgi:hypothetical protein